MEGRNPSLVTEEAAMLTPLLSLLLLGAGPLTEEKKPADEKSPKTRVAPTARKVIPVPRPRGPELFNYRVSLKLKNGRRFTGLVTRDIRFHRRVFEGQHFGTELYELPEKFTLRFVDGLDGSLVLSWNQVAKLEVREAIDLVGLKGLEDDRLMARRARRAREQARLDQLAKAREEAEAEVADDAAAAEDGGKDAKDAKKEKELPALLVKFPPVEGWNAERKELIEWRQTVIGVAPDEREAAFLAAYPQWQPLYREWEVAHKQAEESPEAKGGEGSSTEKGEGPKPSDSKKTKAKPSAKPAPSKPRKESSTRDSRGP